MNKAVVEGLKEAARVFVIAAAAYLLPVLSAGGSINVKAVALGALVAGVKGIDKWINKNEKLKANGLLPF